MWLRRRVSRELGPGEFLVCQVVGAALIVMVCGFFMSRAVEPLSGARALAQADAASAANKGRKQSTQASLLTPEPAQPLGTPQGESVAAPLHDDKVFSEALKARGLETARRADARALDLSPTGPGSEEAAFSRPIRTESFRAASAQRIVTGKFASVEINSREPALENEPAILPPSASSSDEESRQIRSRLHELGFLSSAGKGTCDAACKAAVQDFKLANRLPHDDVLDSTTRERLNSSRAVRFDQSFLGNWCRPAEKKPLRLSINSRRAKSSAGSVCVFHNIHAESRGWQVRATCSEGGESWNANGKITLANGKLVWASERDVVSYSRCK